MVWIEAEASSRIPIAAPARLVLDFIHDVRRTALHFPGMEEIDILGGGCYRFTLVERRAVGQSLRGEFTACYRNIDRRVEWSALDGNMRSEGVWLVEGGRDAAHLSLRMLTGFELALPALLKKPITLFTRFETKRCVEGQLSSIKRAIEAGPDVVRAPAIEHAGTGR